DAQTALAQLDRAYAALTSGRPGPVLFEVPVDVQRATCPDPSAISTPLPTPTPTAPRPQDIQALADLAAGWRRPLLLARRGGIPAGAGALLMEVAERLGAPVFTTAMGKGGVPAEHPLAAGLPWHRATSDLTNMASMVSPLFAEADGLLAVGCRF